MLVLGLGLGNCMQPILLIVQSAVPPTEIGVATSSATFFRQIGGTLGVAVFLSVLFGTVGGNIEDAIREDVADRGVAARSRDNADAGLLDRRWSPSGRRPGPDGGVGQGPGRLLDHRARCTPCSRTRSRSASRSRWTWCSCSRPASACSRS